MNHETFHELLCLRLYGELSSEEERMLAGHLATCGDCRSFEAELGRTLGALERAQPGERELPADWRERLSERIEGEHSRRWLRPLATFAAGLAAGLLVMAALRSGQGPGPAFSVRDELAGAPPFVPRADPPPHSTSLGQLARLGSLLRR